MTRKKYDRDIYDSVSSYDSSTESDEEEEFDEEKAYDIIEYHWGRWDVLSEWVDSVDIFQYLFLKEPKLDKYQSKHLLLGGETDMYYALKNTVRTLCKDLKLPTTEAKVSHVVNLILNKRNNFCIIHRDATHWTNDWSHQLKRVEAL